MDSHSRRSTMRHVQQPTRMDMDRARIAVRQHLHPTPLLAISRYQWLKLDSQQPSGAFKVRGAVAALSRLPSGSHVVTASAGNHAIGVAWAAGTLGHQATIVVPGNASPRKLEILEDMGVNIIPIGTSYDEAEAHALQLAEEGLIYISAYNDPHVIAGQGTILDELVDRIEGNFTVMVPVGGGGLASGIALRAGMIPDRTIRIIGVEAEASQAVSTAVRERHIVPVEVHETLADGLAGNLEEGAITPTILREHGVEFVTVSEGQIENALRTLYLHHDLRAEGAAAVSYAAMQMLDIEGDVVSLITGRNIDDSVLSRIISSR